MEAKNHAPDYEAMGSAFGIAGALIIALAIPASKWGWLLFLGSNFCWLAFAWRGGFRKLFAQTCAFTLSSLLGIANSFFPGNPIQAYLTSIGS